MDFETYRTSKINRQSEREQIAARLAQIDAEQKSDDAARRAAVIQEMNDDDRELFLEPVPGIVNNVEDDIISNIE